MKRRSSKKEKTPNQWLLIWASLYKCARIFACEWLNPYVYAFRVLAFKTCLLSIENYETPSSGWQVKYALKRSQINWPHIYFSVSIEPSTPSTTVKPTSKKTQSPTSSDPNTPSTKPTPSPTPTDPDTSEPDVCSVTKYDAVAVEENHRGDRLTHFFNGNYFWTHTGTRLVKPTKAQKVRDVWSKVETPVDAVYQDKSKKTLVFFKGNKWVLFNGWYVYDVMFDMENILLC